MKILVDEMPKKEIECCFYRNWHCGVDDRFCSLDMPNVGCPFLMPITDFVLVREMKEVDE